jgi:prefoldin subunit 5
VALNEYGFHQIPLETPGYRFEEIQKNYDHAIEDAKSRLERIRADLEEANADLSMLRDLKQSWAEFQAKVEAIEP